MNKNYKETGLLLDELSLFIEGKLVTVLEIFPESPYYYTYRLDDIDPEYWSVLNENQESNNPVIIKVMKTPKKIKKELI